MKIETDSKPYSSWLINKRVICAFSVIFVLAAIYRLSLLASFILLIIFISLSSLFWSRHSLHKISVKAFTRTNRVFAGERVVIKYSLINNKFWPMIWAGWVQPLSPKQVLTPVDDEEWLCREILSDGAIETEKKYFYTRQISWIFWFHEVSWESTWEARRRGVYTSSSVLISSGDGFGLASIEEERSLQVPIEVIIYPALVPIDLSILLKQPWGTDAGNFGFIEDKTLLKGTRDFKSGDPWKHINWRLAAMQRPLQVNIFETVKYRSMHFIVDTRSFKNSPNAEADFDDALSILASCLLELSAKNIAVGISTPTQQDYAIQHLPAEAGEEQFLNIFEVLAHLSLEKSKNIFKEMDDLKLYDSLEQIYVVAYDGQYCSDKYGIIEPLKGKINAFLKYCDDKTYDSENTFDENFDVISMKALKRRM